jgi:hypothetical protein
MKKLHEWYNSNTIGQRILIWITGSLLTLFCLVGASEEVVFLAPFSVVIPGIIIYLELGRKNKNSHNDDSD